MKNIFKGLLCLISVGVISCQDDTLEFERITSFEASHAELPQRANVGDSLWFAFFESDPLSVLPQPGQGVGEFYVEGRGIEPFLDKTIPLGAANHLVYVPKKAGTHAGRIIVENALLQKDTIAYEVAVTKRIPDFNARLYRDSTSGDFMLYLRQQGVEQMNAIYNLEVKGDYDVEMILKVADSEKAYRLGDRITMDYRQFRDNRYTVPIKLDLLSLETDRYSLEFVISDENQKSVSITKALSYSKGDHGVPATGITDETEPVVLPDFNVRVFSSDTVTYNMYLRQQDYQDGDVSYTIVVQGGDNDIEMEIFFAGKEQLYRLGDVIEVSYADFQDNDYLLPIDLKLIEAAKEAYQLRFIVEDQSGKKVTIVKEYTVSTNG